MFFDVPEDGFTIEKGSTKAANRWLSSCEGQGGGIGQSGECEVLVAYGDVEQTNGFSRLSLKANALQTPALRSRPGGFGLMQSN